jgi:bifunctional non-homologous end joining protein LigD
MAKTRQRSHASEVLAAAPAADFPSGLVPMLAKAGDLPDTEGAHAYELKWDGIRALVYIRGGEVHIESRNRNDITKQYPELAALGAALADHEVVLDAEIVAFTEAGVPSFQLLQSRLGLTREDTIRTRAAATPVTLAIFDVLHLDGHDLMPLGYEQRREVLATLDLDGPNWRVSEYHVGGGHEMLASVVEHGLEGVMVKRLDAPYGPGKRTSAWTKVKQQQRQEFVVGGWTEGNGSRAGQIGALLIGHQDVRPSRARQRKEPQRLMYAGSVGTGFGHATLEQLAALLAPLAVDESPFEINSPGADKPVGKWQAIRAKDRTTGKPVASKVHYVRPELVVELEFTEFTRDGTLRHPSFQGLRDDKDPADVVREDTPDLTD